MNMNSSEAKGNRLLIVEDDIALADVMQAFLKQEGYRVTVLHSGEEAVQVISEQQPDLVILDWMLPGRDGLDICRAVKGQSLQRILMLTAKDDVLDQIIGLETGADDYLVKPVQPRLLLARVRALLRRSLTEPEPTDDGLTFGQLSIQPKNRQVIWQGEWLELTTNEFDLLWLLASHAGQVLNRDDILAALRGIGYDGLDRSVDLRISRLRKKLSDDPHQPQRIKTIWGKGYLFAPDCWDETAP